MLQLHCLLGSQHEAVILANIHHDRSDVYTNNMTIIDYYYLYLYDLIVYNDNKNKCFLSNVFFLSIVKNYLVNQSKILL